MLFRLLERRDSGSYSFTDLAQVCYTAGCSKATMNSPNSASQMVVASSRAGKEWRGRGAAGREDRGEESDDTGVNM